MVDDLKFGFHLSPETGAENGLDASPEVPETAKSSRSAPSEGPLEGPETPRTRRRAGFYLKTKPDGSVNWDALPAEVKDRARAAGMAPQASAAPLVLFSPAECKQLYAVLGELESVIAAALTKSPRPLARRFFAYSEMECAVLSEPTSRVLSKHGGEWLAKYKDEFVLLMTLTALHQRKVIDFAEALKRHRESQAPAPPQESQEPDEARMVMS